jgi:hypothetical protein
MDNKRSELKSHFVIGDNENINTKYDKNTENK